MFSGGHVLNKNNEILRKNMRRKYEVWDIKPRYEKDSLKNVKKAGENNLRSNNIYDLNDEFENIKLRRLLMSLCAIILVIGLVMLR